VLRELDPDATSVLEGPRERAAGPREDIRRPHREALCRLARRPRRPPKILALPLGEPLHSMARLVGRVLAHFGRCARRLAGGCRCLLGRLPGVPTCLLLGFCHRSPLFASSLSRNFGRSLSPP